MFDKESLEGHVRARRDRSAIFLESRFGARNARLYGHSISNIWRYKETIWRRSSRQLRAFKARFFLLLSPFA